MRISVLAAMICLGAIALQMSGCAMSAREREALENAPAEVRAEVAQLKSRDPKMRSAAAISLCEMGPAAAAAGPMLVALLKDDEAYFDVEVNGHRYFTSPGSQAAICIGKLGETVVPGLIETLKSPNDGVRSRALYALWDTDDPRSVETSIHVLLTDTKTWLRYEALRRLPSNDPRVVPALVKLLKHRELGPDVATALEHARDPSTIAPLIAALAHARNPLTRSGAASALGSFAGPVAIEPLLAAMHDRHGNVRYSAAQALIAINEPQAMDRLIAILDADVMERPYAASALTQINDPRVVEPLIRVLRRPYDPDAPPGPDTLQWFFVPENASKALGKLHDFRATPALVALLDHPVLNTRVIAARALVELGDPSALDALRAARDGNVRSVQNEMATAVERLEAKQANETPVR
jgi:HEAT repeat protein